ncbi:putative carbohydrate kinase family protein [Paratrimastix pyriformis]|uniref:Carbohydrate kinase family protein n=1 Tax=Paratrimastix pyriformis TaxID=342808 RepID=A0ABQ8UK58_9EUKA|nr:putative carbohydrate kinase family protein [Paratrimastix pyriformis]
MQTPDFDIVAVGGCGMDIIMNVPDVTHMEITDRNQVIRKYTALEFSSKCSVQSVLYAPGGSAANVACDARCFGMRTAFIGKVGVDGNGGACLNELSSRGVDISSVVRTPEDTTAVSVVLLTPYGADRSILAYKGTTNLLTPADVNVDICRRTRCLAWTSLSSPKALEALLLAVETAKTAGALISSAPSMAVIRQYPAIFGTLLTKSDVVSLNDDELKEFTKAQTVLGGIKHLLGMGLKLVSVTMGEKGSLITDGRIIVETGVYPVQVKDTTGAGDAFATGLICGYLERLPLPEIAKRATALAAMEVQVTGVRLGLPTNREEVDTFLNHNTVQQRCHDFEQVASSAAGLLGA